MSGSGGCQRSLARANPSPVVELNRAVAVGMRDGPSAGLALVDVILERGDLADYRLAHSARAVLYRRLGRTAEPASPTSEPSASRARSRSGDSSRATAGRAAGLGRRALPNADRR